MNNFLISGNAAISDTGFLFLPNTGESFTMNAIGTEIFKMLQTKITFEDIKKVILENYDIDEILFENDFFDFANQLKHYGILEEL